MITLEQMKSIIYPMLQGAFSMPAATTGAIEVWYGVVGFADLATLKEAIIELSSKPRQYRGLQPSELKATYLSLYNAKKEARNPRKAPDASCKYCRGEGWVKRLIPNGIYGLALDTSFGCDFLPCGCCDNKRGHELYNQLMSSPHWVWDEYLRGFRPNDAWIGEPPLATAKEIQAVTELFAKEPPPRDNGSGWELDAGVDYFSREECHVG